MDGSDPPPQKRQKREPSSSPLAIADIAPSSRVIDQKDTHGESDTFGWVSCSENSEAERLAIKEKAVEQAQGFCAKLYVMLQAAIEDIQAGSDDAVIMGQEIIKQWLSEHDKVCAQHRDYGVLVGVEGPTGAGKSSFLGSLLRIEELLPSGQEGAATAVVGKVSWNYDDTPGHEYRAEVSFRKKAEVERELSLLLLEMSRRNDIEEDDYEDEGKRAEDMAFATNSINHQLPKFQAVWNLDEELLGEYAENCNTFEGEQAAIKQILESNPVALHLMNEGTRHLFSSEPQDLSYEIKPFLDSTTHKYGGKIAFSAWPLVEIVSIFVKADILKTGINLVDLPGCGDAVDSRAEVTRKFRENLDVRMVVSPICRAADEKEGRALIQSGYEEAQMKLEGKLNSRGFCVVLSKIDDITVESYIKSSELGQDKEIVKKVDHLKSLRNEKSRLRSTYNSLQTDKRKAERNFSKASTMYQRQSERVSKYSDAAAVPQSVKKKKQDLKRAKGKCKAAIKEAIIASEDFDKKMRDLDFRVEQLDTWLYHQAIQTRNTNVERKIHDKFSRKHAKNTNGAMDGSEDQRLLSVLPVSTKAFWQVKNLSQPMAGFPTQRCTGVPAAEQWLHYATLERREKHLDTVLANFHKLMEKVWSYSKEQCRGTESKFTKHEVESSLADAHATFDHKFRDFFAKWSKKIQEIQPLPNRTDEMKLFNKKARAKAARWSYKYPEDRGSLEKLHWNTYQAILFRGGVRFTSRGATSVVYTWLEDLATLLLTDIAEKWDEKLNKYLPGLKDPIMEQFSEIWKAYLQSLLFAIHERAPSLEPEFTKLIPALQDLQRTVENNIRQTLDNLSHDASHTHTEILADLEMQLAPTFRKALEIRGRGMHQARQDLVSRKINKEFKTMSIDVMKTLGGKLDERKDMIPGELEIIATSVIEDVRALVACLINNLLENDAEGTEVQCRKEVLHEQVREVLLEMESRWRFHSQNDGHILLQDLSIPKNLDDVLVKQEDQERQMFDWNEELAELSE